MNQKYDGHLGIPKESRDPYRLLIGKSPKFLHILRQLPRLAECSNKVLILGETGTGKELFAHAIHEMGLRRDKSFVPVNCAALPASMVESELFGHAAGAFTDAKAFSGRAREAEGGTLFLDEVNSLPLFAQPKLLRFLNSGEVTALGTSSTFKTDVRVLAASNTDLERAVQQGCFRADLFHRLNGIVLRIPPLRERVEDILLLANHFIARCAEHHNRPFQLSPEAIQHLRRHDWPGNVRELKNVIENAAVFADEALLIPADLPISSSGPNNELGGLRKARDTADQYYLRQLLPRHQWNVASAAEEAGVSIRTLYVLIKQYGIEVRSMRAPGANGRISPRA